ncbi:phosphoserine phosphatase-like isoform X2 [Babylonia areolata]
MPTEPRQEEAIRSVWQKADAVCFDVDSTVCKDEGLDELAAFCGVGEEVKAWTQRAMGGAVSFREALSERLKIVQPTQQQVETFVASRPPQLSDGIEELVHLLQSRNTTVFLVSGGFRRLIEPAAQLLNIPKEHIFANRLLFDENGQYSGFDQEEPTSESGGKPRVVALLKEKYGFQKLVMIGDGATDMEASPPADAFIGYGGNVVRDSVKRKAGWFVMDFKDLISALQSAN